MKFFTILAMAVAPVLAMAEGLTYEQQVAGAVSVNAGSELHITGVDAPLAPGASIDLTTDDSWLVFEGVKASTVKAKWLGQVTVAGQPAKHPDNVRLAQWGSGCIVIPNGYANDRTALTLYSQPDCKGQTMTCGINTYYRSLGPLDNHVQSFTLKRGYMATLANNPDGTGHSRVWIAADSNIVVPVMPEGFVTYRGADGTFDANNTESFVSFVRVMRWEWTGKKGWCGGSEQEMVLSNCDSYYRWSADKIYDNPSKNFYEFDREFSPIKQQYWWPGWDQIDSLQNVIHLCGYNEPNQTDQANQPASVAIEQWPYMFRSGLRLGSPAPTGVYTSWSDDFWAAIKRYNYRCDINVTHIYEYLTADQWRSRVEHMVEESGGRPCWVTEYNYGANWTSEQWPDQQGSRVDVHGNLIDNSGKRTNKEVIVNRPATAANMEHHRQWMVNFLPGIDAIDKLERTHFYNWVEDARSIIINGELTPSGEVFASHVSVPGYKASQAYDHVWKIAPPYLTPSFADDYEHVRLKFYDHNGETGQMYVFSMLTPGAWVVVDTLRRGIDYEAGDWVDQVIEIPSDISTNQIKVYAVGYNGQKSIESPFAITGESISAPKIKVGDKKGESITIMWDAVENAKQYRVRAGTSKDNLRLVDRTTETEYTHRTTPETAYYFQVESVGRFGSSSASNVMRIYSGTSGIADAQADEIEITAARGAIVIDSPVQCSLPLYAPDGRLVRTLQIQPGRSEIPVAPGAYILNRQKLLVR